MFKHGRHTAIVEFSADDIASAGKTDSGIIIPFGKHISDTELFYTPQRCTIKSIGDDKFFKEGDVVYIDYSVFTKGKGMQREEMRKLEHEQELYYCYFNEMYCKIENGILLAAPNYLFVKKQRLKVKTTLLVPDTYQDNSEKGVWQAKIKYIHPDTEKEMDLQSDDLIICSKNSDYNKNRIEGEFYFIVFREDVLAKVIFDHESI